MSKSAGGGRGGDYHESEKSLLSFAGSDMHCHLHQVNSKRAETMEVLIVILYNRDNGGVSSPDLARIFISLGGDARGGGGGVGVIVGRGVQFVLNGEYNGAVDDVGCRRRAARLSALLCDKATGLWRPPTSDHEDSSNDGEDNRDTAWELASNRNKNRI